MIGYGAYAKVLEVHDSNTDERYALKVVEKQPLAVRGMLEQLAREFGVQRGIQHPNIVRVVELLEDAQHAYLLLDLCVGGSLWHAAQQFPNSEVPANLTASWLREAASGVSHLHHLGLVHRDIKLENLLVDAQGFVRICDFGWCAFEADQPRGMCGTPQLAPPEVTRGEVQTTKVDCWALGACLVQLVTGRPLTGPHDAWLPPAASDAARDLAVALLNVDPAQRLSAADALTWAILTEAEPPPLPDAAAAMAASMMAAFEGREATAGSPEEIRALREAWRRDVATAARARARLHKQVDEVRAAAREAVELSEKVMEMSRQLTPAKLQGTLPAVPHLVADGRLGRMFAERLKAKNGSSDGWNATPARSGASAGAA